MGASALYETPGCDAVGALWQAFEEVLSQSMHGMTMKEGAQGGAHGSCAPAGADASAWRTCADALMRPFRHASRTLVLNPQPASVVQATNRGRFMFRLPLQVRGCCVLLCTKSQSEPNGVSSHISRVLLLVTVHKLKK